jgi:hypothetical protein
MIMRTAATMERGYVVVALSKIPATPSSTGNGVSLQISTNRGQYQLGNETTWFGSRSAQFRIGVKVANWKTK